MRFFRRTPPPDRTDVVSSEPRDPAYYEAREAYQQEKQLALQKQIELLARLNRMGYDFDLAARKGRRDDDRTIQRPTR